MPNKTEKYNINDWFLHGKHDLETARLILREGGYSNVAATLLEQAMEKYLKGYLLSVGWNLKKTHDLETLVAEAMTHDKAFEKFLDLGRELSAIYIDDRYPPGPPVEYPKKKVTSLLGQTEKLIALIKEHTH